MPESYDLGIESTFFMLYDEIEFGINVPKRNNLKQKTTQKKRKK